MERISTLFRTKKQLYAEGAPIIIVARALLKDNENDEILAQIKIKNISEKVISAITFSVKAFDAYDNELEEIENYQYLDLSAKRNDEFGQKQAIHFTNSDVRQFAISSMEVVFEDSSIMKTTGDVVWEEMPEVKLLEDVLPSELVEQYKRDTFTDATYCVAEYKDLWTCSCGNVNKEEESNCCKCGNSKKELISALNEDSLQEKNLIYRKELAEKEAQKIIENRKKKQKHIKFAMISTMVISFVLIITILISQILVPFFSYTKAAREADNLIASINNFSATDDSQIKAAEDAVALLTEKDYEQLKNLTLLTEKRNQQKALVIDDEINKIGSVSLNSSEKIRSARKAYDGASNEVKAFVKNYEVLISAETTFEKLQEEEEKRKEEQRAKEYKSNLLYATYEILSGVVEAANVGELILAVWQDAITMDWNSETAKYTTNAQGQFVDFNTALANLRADSSIQESLDFMEDNKAEVAKYMNKLQNPPKEYQEIYNVMKNLYGSYIEFMTLASSPTGNYFYYSSSFNDTAAETYKYCSEISAYLGI